VIKWTGDKWGGNDVPDMRPNAAPDENVMPFIMTGKAWRGCSRREWPTVPSPSTTSPSRRRSTTTPSTRQPKATSNPAARVYKGDMEVFGKAKDFPYVCHHLPPVEHFHYWTKHSKLNAIMQPEQFVEIGEELAKEKGHRQWRQGQGAQQPRLHQGRGGGHQAHQDPDVDGKKVHTVGIPIHWGFKGVTKPGFITNTLTPFVGDANSQTPEFKAFLVNIEKI
jgi:anaerobic selenocysteine-containing dehydrogenase